MRSICLLLTLLLCTSISAQVTILLKNDTGSRLESVILKHKYVGPMEPGETKTVIVESLRVDSNIPLDMEMSARYKNTNLQLKGYSSPCGTFQRSVRSGTFTQLIKVRTNQNGDAALYLQNNGYQKH